MVNGGENVSNFHTCNQLFWTNLFGTVRDAAETRAGCALPCFTALRPKTVLPIP